MHYIKHKFVEQTLQECYDKLRYDENVNGRNYARRITNPLGLRIM